MDKENIYEKLLKRGKESKTVSEQLEVNPSKMSLKDIQKLEELSKFKIKTMIVSSENLLKQTNDGLEDYIVKLIKGIKQQLNIKTKQLASRMQETKEKEDKKITALLLHFKTKISKQLFSVKNNFKKLSSFFKNSLIPTFKSMKNIVSSLYDFLSTTLSRGWSVVDSFINSISPNSWSLAKNVVSKVATAFMWLWNVGKKTIEFIYSGVKTIFKAGYYVIESAAKILYKGVRGLFSWWFNMLIHTLTNPAMLLFNLPIFLGITGALFIALGTVSSLIFDMGKALISPIFKVATKLFSWIWSGVEIMWDWITTAYKGSVLESFVDTSFNTVKNWLMGNTVIKNIVNIVSNVYTWIIENGIPIAKKVWEVTQKIVNFVKTNSPSSMIVEFINLLNSDSTTMKAVRNLVPGFAKLTKYVTSKYGFLPGIVGGSAMSLEDMRTAKTSLSKRQVSTILEHESLNLLSSGYSEIDVKKQLLDNVIPKIRSNLENAKIPKEEIDKVLDASIRGSKNILASGGVGMIPDYEKAIATQEAVILSYENIIEKAKGGLLDPTDPNTNKVLESLRTKMIKVLDSKNRTTSQTIFKKSETSLEKLINLQKQMEESNKRKSKLLSVEEFTSRFYDMRDYQAFNSEIGDLEWLDPARSWTEKVAIGTYSFRNTIHNMTGKAINNIANNSIAFATVTISGLAGADAAESSYQYLQENGPFDVAKNITGSDAQRYNQEQEQAVSPAADLARMSNVNTPMTKHAFGGLKILENPKVKPLDLEAANFIRSKIDNIENSNKMDKSKEKKEEVSNITIIENYIAKQESYETYTLSQLSRGLLAGG